MNKFHFREGVECEIDVKYLKCKRKNENVQI